MTPAKPPARGRGTGKGSGDDGGQSGEQRSSAEVRTAFITGNTFRARAVQYVVVDGDALFEGDIVLGPADQVEQESQALAAELQGATPAGVLITGAQFRWPDCTVPYTIDPALPDQARVTDAIAHWEANTRFRFVLRTAANQATHPDWVTFRPAGGCSSAVGRRGGQQFVNLAPGCTTGNTIHEIGHVVGMWHEQSREDRDAFVTINWANIQAGFEHNFNQHVTDGDDVGPYDYGSIMHYPRTAFSVGGGAETITPTDPSANIGQRTALSAGDIATANSMCPKGPIETIKETAPETIKEISPETVKERFPETVKERIPETAKERIPETVKERIPETIKERIPETRKEIAETIKENVEPPVTIAERVQPGPGPGPIVNPVAGGGLLPFALRTPHQDLLAGAAADPAEELLGQLAAVAETLAALEGQQAALLEQYQQLVALLAEMGVQ